MSAVLSGSSILIDSVRYSKGSISAQLLLVGQYLEAWLVKGGVTLYTCSANPASPNYRNQIFGLNEPQAIFENCKNKIRTMSLIFNSYASTFAGTPSWLPSGATAHFDFEKNQFYWGGSVRTINDLTVHPTNVGYMLDIDWLDMTNGSTVVVDAYLTPGVDPSGMIFSSISTGGERLELQPSALSSGADRKARAVLYHNGAYMAFLGDPLNQNNGKYLHRWAFSVKNGAPALGCWNGNESGSIDTGNRTIQQPYRIGFGNWAQGSASPFVGGTLKKVTIYRGQYSTTLLDTVGSDGVNRPLHFVTDSFGNGYRPQEALQKLVNEKRGGYIAISTDTAGGTLMDDSVNGTGFFQRMSSYIGTNREKLLKSTLVILDGGLELDPPNSAIAIARIVSLLNKAGHDRWIYVESGPSGEGYNEANWNTWRQRSAFIREFCLDRFVPTWVRAMAQADSSPADQADLAAGRWPSSLTLGDKFHPNTGKGADFIGQVIYDALLERGWV